MSGKVVDAATGRPIGGVLVFLRGPAGQTGQASDAKGRFLFEGLLPSDHYIISATKPGYLDVTAGGGGTGVGNAAWPPIVVGQDQWVRGLRIALRRAGAIRGVIVDGRGMALVGARVRALSETWIAGHRHFVAGPVVRTDDRGAYRLQRLPAGRYYVEMPSVAEALPAADRVAEPGGGPEAGHGGRQPTFDAPLLLSDRLHYLVLGRYPIPPRLPDGSLGVYPTTFFPSGTVPSEAVPIGLSPGEERDGADFRVNAVSAAGVSGRIEGPPESYVGMTVRLLVDGAEDLGIGGETATALVDHSGAFAFFGVPAGQYTIEVRGTTASYALSNRVPPLPRHPGSANSRAYKVFAGPDGTVVRADVASQSGYWGRQRVETDGRDDVTGVVVRMRRGVTVTGRIVWDGPRQSFAGDISLLNAEPGEGDLSLGVIGSQTDPLDPDRFAIEGLLPGRYVLSPTPLLRTVGMSLKSVVCGGRDVAHAVIDAAVSGDLHNCVVTFTDRGARISGYVREDAGSTTNIPPGSATVLVFPADSDAWTGIGLTAPQFRRVRPASDGSFDMHGLPAGDYLIVAVSDDAMATWLRPSRLHQLSVGATLIHVDWGDSVTQDLTVAEATR